jgi:hypothetical protein
MTSTTLPWQPPLLKLVSRQAERGAEEQGTLELAPTDAEEQGAAEFIPTCAEEQGAAELAPTDTEEQRWAAHVGSTATSLSSSHRASSAVNRARAGETQGPWWPPSLVHAALPSLFSQSRRRWG